MGNQQNQIESELKCLELLKIVEPHVFNLLWHRGDIGFDAPDFQTEVSRKKIGLELTSYFQDMDSDCKRLKEAQCELTQFENGIESLKKTCSELTCDRNSGYQARIQILMPTPRVESDMWEDHMRVYVLKKNDIKALAKVLVEFVEQKMPADSYIDIPFSSLPKMARTFGVRQIRVHSPSKPDRRHIPFWSFSQAGNLKALDWNIVESAIKAKNEVWKQISMRFDQTWLVIRVGESGLSSYGEIPDEFKSRSICSDFNRVWLFDSWKGSLFELRKIAKMALGDSRP